MLTLVLGGARSGKSDLAVRLGAASGRPVLFVATMEACDDETRARVEAHRAARPAAWRTLEAPRGILAAVRAEAREDEPVVIDCLTLWGSNELLARVDHPEDIPPGTARVATDDLVRQAHALAEWASSRESDVIVVSNEVGSGVVPAYPLGRLFRDALGAVNTAIAARADRVYYLVAGLALELKSLGARALDAFGEGPQP